MTCNFPNFGYTRSSTHLSLFANNFFLNAGPHSTPIIDAKCFGLIAHSNLFRERQVNQMKGPGTVSILVEFPSVSFPIKKGRGRPKKKKKKKKWPPIVGYFREKEKRPLHTFFLWSTHAIDFTLDVKRDCEYKIYF